MNAKSVLTIPFFALGYAFLLATSLFARDSSDVIVMKNGDHLTGEIKGLNAGVLYVEHGIHTRNKLGSMVEGGASGKQAVVPREDRRRLGVHRDTQYREHSSGRPMEIEVAKTPDKKS